MSAVVTDQIPEAGSRATRTAVVQLWTDRDGGSGVREPPRPPPTALNGRKAADEEEAVG